MSIQKNDSTTHKSSHGYGDYILVWLGLITLTGLTAVVAGINFGKFNIAVALVIAATKAYLVLTIFMHLRFEQKSFKVFVFVAMLFLMISFTLLFTDYTSYVR